ncbi:MAG: hypothetical protein A6F70_09770 [Cycloclasticus sp. symbiont of Bathymodiolus heckerae]|nr:MAG: hypothetical protein A6F70_09770 [Cycloclasticus sp. symbiont of Bathymodiolus heckerae]
MQTENKSPQEIFFAQWNIYQNVIRNNYMYHAEIIAIVSREIKQLDRLAILDLGCGDSYVISQSINKTDAENNQIDYRGVDLSLPALEIGKENLKLLNGTTELINDDLLSELQSNQQSYDIILLGYSLHHLTTAEKQECFARIAELLSEKGVLVFYDLEMLADENQPSYIDRACELFTQHWNNFNAEEINSICTHVVENDIPENQQFYTECFKKAGFSVVNKMFSDKDHLFSVYTAKK